MAECLASLTESTDNTEKTQNAKDNLMDGGDAVMHRVGLLLLPRG